MARPQNSRRKPPKWANSCLDNTNEDIYKLDDKSEITTQMKHKVIKIQIERLDTYLTKIAKREKNNWDKEELQ